jgi:hypothetical protein
MALTPVQGQKASATYNWSFGVNIAGSVLVLIAAIFIATHNPPPRGRKLRSKGDYSDDSLRTQRTRKWLDASRYYGLRQPYAVSRRTPG